jgi:hypothetical protein
MGGMHLKRGGYVVPSNLFTESLFAERGIDCPGPGLDRQPEAKRGSSTRRRSQPPYGSQPCRHDPRAPAGHQAVAAGEHDAASPHGSRETGPMKMWPERCLRPGCPASDHDRFPRSPRPGLWPARPSSPSSATSEEEI